MKEIGRFGGCLAAGVLMALPAVGRGALAAGLTASAKPKISKTDGILRQQTTICDPDLTTDVSLAITAARLDLTVTFSNLPAGLAAEDIVSNISVSPIAPFTFSQGSTTTFDSATVLRIANIAVSAVNPPPAGPADFATLTLDFEPTIPQAQFNKIVATYAFALQPAAFFAPGDHAAAVTRPAAGSFIEATDGTNTYLYTLGGERNIDVSQTDSAALPEPTAVAGGVMTLALGLARRPRRT